MTEQESKRRDVDHSGFQRDRLTLLCYGLLAYMGYLFVSPAVFLPRLRDELGLSYSITASHIAATAAGAVVMSALLPRLERRYRRRPLVWGGVVGSACGSVLLVSARHPGVSIAAMLVIGLTSTPIVVLTQAVLADIHGESRAVALAEGSTVASVGSVLSPVIIGGAASVLPVDWRAGVVFGALCGMAAAAVFHRWPVPDGGTLGKERALALPTAFRLPAGLMFACVSVEVCTTFLGPTYLRDAVGYSEDATAALAAVFLITLVVGRIGTSVLTRRLHAPRVLAIGLVVTAVGFALLWGSTGRVPSAVGYAVTGVGVAAMFPLNIALIVAAAPERSGQAVSASLLVAALADLVAPLALGVLADVTDIRSAFVVVPIGLIGAAVLLRVVSRRLRPRDPATDTPATDTATG